MNTIGEEISGADPSQLHIYNDYDLAYEIAHAIKPAMDRIVELRNAHTQLTQKDPDATFMIMTESLKRELELKRQDLESPTMDVPLPITNAQALQAVEFEVAQNVDDINDTCYVLEKEAEEGILNQLVDDDSHWTGEQTKEVSDKPLSRWKRLSRETKFDYLAAYARSHTVVRGVRSETMIHYNAYPGTSDYFIRPKPFITFEEVTQRST